MKKILSFLLLGMLCSIGTTWAETTKTYTFDDGVALATDWDVQTIVPSGGEAVCQITSSLSGASFSAKESNYLGLAYKNKSNVGITITTTASYNNISEVSIDAVAGDNSKPSIAAYIVTADGDVEVFAAVGTKDGFATGGSNKWGNKIVSLTSAVSGKLKIVTTASSSGKYAALDNIKITYGESGGSDPEPGGDPVDPTITFNDGAYTVGGDALDLSTLFTSNSSGAVTYSVKTDGGTSAAINGTSFTATTAGTAVVTASQAAVAGTYNAKSVDANIVVSAASTPDPQPAGGNVYQFRLNGNNEEYVNGTKSESLTFFAYNSSKHNFNTKFNGCIYDGVTYNSGLKMEGATDVSWTTTTSSTVKIVQSTWSTHTIKLNDDELAVADASAITGGRVYTVSNLPAGTYHVKRGSGESGLFAVTVECAAATVVPTITTDLASSKTTYVAVETIFEIEATNADSYQWYSNTSNTTEGGVAIEGATSAQYAYTATEAGTMYLYCVATNNVGSTNSTICAVTVEAATTYSVTYNWGSHSEIAIDVPTQGVLVEGGKFTVASLPENIYYRFNGWNDGTTTYQPGDEYTIGTSDVELTAQWITVSQTDVTSEMTWDWTNAGTSNVELKSDSYPVNGGEFVMANMAEIPNNSEFNSQALLVACQFANRGGNSYFQGNTIKFNVTVPGTVTVWFSNTSNREDNQKNRRFLYINGENTNVYTLRQDTWESAGMHVDAGEVILNAFTGEATPAATMIRVQKIVFTPDVDIVIGEGGYSTYATDYNFTVSGAAVYKAAVNGAKDAVVLTEVENAVVPANEGIIIKGTAGATATITLSAAAASNFNGNNLVGVPAAINEFTVANAYVIATQVDEGETEATTKFYPYSGASFPAHKAYMVITPAQQGAPIRIVFAEETTTDINSLEASEKAQKFFENGNLYILRDGVVYDATGRVVR